MRQVFLNKGAIALKEVCEPILHDHSVLISVYHSLVTPTHTPTLQSPSLSFSSAIPDKIKKIFSTFSTKDTHTAESLLTKQVYSHIKPLGYSCSGKIIAVGKKVTKFRAGDFVACSGVGFANHADFACVPQHLVVPISNKSLLQEASFIALGGLAFDKIRKAQLQIGEYVCIVGLDVLGQLAAQIAKLSGCKVIGIDNNPYRRKVAQELGIHETFSADHPNLVDDITHLTKQRLINCTIITEQRSSLISEIIQFSQQESRIILPNNYQHEQISLQELHQKEITFINFASYNDKETILALQPTLQNTDNYQCPPTNKSFEAFIQLVEDDVLKIKPLISHKISINHSADAYKKIERTETLGIILNLLPKTELSSTALSTSNDDSYTFKPAQKSSLRVGIIGAGQFTHTKLLPILSRLRDTNIITAADPNVAKSLNITSVYGAKKATVDAHELFYGDDVNVVFINSPDKLHSKQAVKALKQGKAVFLEKPMATSLNDLHALSTFIQSHKETPFCVDYNRSFAPFIKKTKLYLEERQSPAMIFYRMNIGTIPKEEMLRREMGSGRLIGEACHIFDLFLYLIDAEPITLSVESLKTTYDHVYPTDNFSAQISFADGSICTLVYTTMGNTSAGKERMEIFYDSKTIIMDDYVSLEGYGLPLAFNENVKRPNFGQEALINSFMRSLQQPKYKPLMPVQRLTKATEITLLVDQLALRGGGEKTL